MMKPDTPPRTNAPVIDKTLELASPFDRSNAIAMRRTLLISAGLVIATLAAYWPVHHAEFINFDDPVYVTNNENVFRGLTWHGIVWAFTAIRGGNWHPVTWLS